MTYTAPATVNTGDLWTAANQNTFIKANMEFIASDRPIPLELSRSLAPMSGLNAAPLEQIESSDAGTFKPILHQSRFDDNTGEARMWLFKAPTQLGAGAQLKILYHMASANTSKNAVLEAYLAAISDGDTTVTAKAFDAANQLVETVPDTAGELDLATITLTNADSIAAGDWVCLMLLRAGNNGSDDASGDLIVTDVEFIYDFV